MRLIGEAEARSNRRFAVAERIVSQAEARGEIRFLRRVEPVDARQARVGQAFAERAARSENNRRQTPFAFVDVAEIIVAQPQIQIEFRIDLPIVLEEKTGLELREITRKVSRLAGVWINGQCLSERLI